MAVIHPPPVHYHAGPEHCSPFPPLLALDNFSENFVAAPATPRCAFVVFQEKLKELAVDQFPYRFPQIPTKEGVPPWKLDSLRQRAAVAESINEVMDEKKFIMEWRNSPWYKECKWSDDYDQLQYKLLKAKRPLRLQTIYQQFESLNLCDEEITEIGSQLFILKCLKTLSLADNRLHSLNMETLPVSLKHLELYGNGIKTLTGFCAKSLKHLGLAANNISSLLLVIGQADLRSLVSLDLGENLIAHMDECIASLQSLPQLINLRLAGNPISLKRSYRKKLVTTACPKLLCLDGEETLAQARQDYANVSYGSVMITSSVDAPSQCILILAINEILEAPQPSGYKTPEEQIAYPLTKWVYTVEIAFPGALLPTKPALPPPSPETLKAEEKEKAKKAKAAKGKKKGRLTTPPPAEPVPEPDDPFYLGVPGMTKVLNDGYDWVWAIPVIVGSRVPLLVSGDDASSTLYEYLRRGMKVKLFLKRVVYTPTVTGKKFTKPKLSKGQKPDLWAVPLTPEIADSVEMAQFTIPLVQLLHGDSQVLHRCTISSPPQMAAPVIPGAGKKKAKPPAAKKDAKSRLAALAKIVEVIPVAKGPMIVNMCVAVHHDRNHADLLSFPPEMAPYVAPELKPTERPDTHLRTPTKSVSPDRKSANIREIP